MHAPMQAQWAMCVKLVPVSNRSLKRSCTGRVFYLFLFWHEMSMGARMQTSSTKHTSSFLTQTSLTRAIAKSKTSGLEPEERSNSATFRF